YISGGENVYPAEVEQVLHDHPSIAECAVVGVADEKWGEVGRAFVVVRRGAELGEADVLAHLEGRLARYKLPASVVFVPELPHTYRDAGLGAVVFTGAATTATGHPPLSSEQIAEEAAEHADVLIPFGSVDPHQGEAAVDRARRLVEDHGVRGFKFHPSLQAF